jgi:acyl-CoA hydrolase
MIEARPTAYSRVTLSRIMTSHDVNLYGTVHGGVIMKFVDDAAGTAAARHCGFNAVTVSIDEIALNVASAYLVFVGVDAFGKPREVPKVVPGDTEDERRFAEADIRRAISAHRGE